MVLGVQLADLVRRQHSGNGCFSKAVYSGCGAYRYALTRTWDPKGPRLLWIMLNPSTADERRNDPTIERCERRARQLGFGAFRVVNIFGYRATDPADLRRAALPVGPSNDRIAMRSVTGWAGGAADMVLCGWGSHGTHLGRGAEFAAKLSRAGRTLHHLGLTDGGQPRHPLYISYAQTPLPWEAADLRRITDWSGTSHPT